MPERDLEQIKKNDYYGKLYKELDIMSFLNKPITGMRKTAQPTLDLPDIGKKEENAAAADITTPNLPDMAGGETAPVPAPPATPEPGGIVPPPLPETGALGVEKGFSDEEKQKIDETISDIKDHLDQIEDELKSSILKDKILEEVKEHYKALQNELESLKKRKIPEREFYDTEGTYRDHLYSMAVRVLDEFLPELFGDIPDYDFISTQVSRAYEDGTIADALVTLIASVVREGMKYDFKIEIPVLNGLMQYPMYIQRGQKIIPLTQQEIQQELDSISYKKMDFETPYKEKDNIFNNIGENIHRRPDTQKWYKVRPNTYKPVGLSSDHKFSPQRGKDIK